MVKIIRVPIETPTLWPHTTTNSYLIGNNEESLLVDAGYDKEVTRKVLEQMLQKYGLAIPKAILLTHSHPDHAPGVRQLIGWSPIVYCHSHEKDAIESAISPVNQIELLRDGDQLTIAGMKLQVIHGPGHTKGQLNLYIPSKQILLAGDNIVAEGTTWIGPPEGNMREYLHTLQRLKQLPLSKIGPGHGDWVEQPYEHIDFVIKRRLLRENQIQKLLREHKKLTASNLTKLIYKDTIHPSIFDVAQRTIEAHLIKLIEEDKVTKQCSEYFIVD
ncbi:MBL fold metallo-hydrolase [Pueribacillus sp. YX66]|uniref:MBL fold metallo-hydrolase n=1 Tax=Pueribacillus sp. YX66 TaxID=3229242 RepID=UPI00358D5095